MFHETCDIFSSWITISFSKSFVLPKLTDSRNVFSFTLLTVWKAK